MDEERYRAYLERNGYAQSTVSTSIASVRRIERDEELDVDREFDRDQLAALINKFKYSMDDFRAGSPNPTRLKIEPDNLYRDLAFFRSALRSYQRFKSGGDSDAVSPTVESADEIIADDLSQTFALERDMQVAIRANIKQMGADLSIVDNGAETQVEAGNIDILAKDSSGNMVVIELKAGTCRAPAVAQVLAYMGCIRNGSNVQVRGILVAGDFEKRVQLAAKAVPNLTLKRYTFRFEFSDV